MAGATVKDSPLWPDIEDITAPNPMAYKPTFEISIQLHTVDKDLNLYDGILIHSLMIDSDYINKVGDYIEVQVRVPIGTYTNDVYPYLDNMEATLYIARQEMKGNCGLLTKERYKAVFLQEKNKDLPNQIAASRADLNQAAPNCIVTLQLLDRSVETIRIKTTQGSYDNIINKQNKDMHIKPFLQSLLSSETDKITVENRPVLDNIAIEEPNNEDELKAIIIPSGTRVIEVPEYLQTRNIGVYNAGIGVYVHKFATSSSKYEKTLFVYSLYNPEKYNQAESKIIFYSPAVGGGILQSPTTYKYDDGLLRAVVTGMTISDDKKETNQMSSGIGFRTSNSQSYMKKPVEITDDGPKFKGDGLNTEIACKNRADGLNFAPNKSVSTNHFVCASEIAAKMGYYVTLVGYNQDPSYLFPGAACMINYEGRDEKIKTVKGCIHRVISSFSNDNKSQSDNASTSYVTFLSTVIMSVFVSTAFDEDKSS